MSIVTKEFKPQSEDYFNMADVGITATGFAPQAPAKLLSTTPYYSTYYNGKQVNLGYTFMYWDGVAFPNAVPDGVPYFGAVAIEGLSLKIDQIVITNDYTSTADIVVDLIKASPANIIKSSLNIIPPVQLARYHIASGDTVSLNKDDIDIVFKNNIPQTEVTPYYMMGEGLALAFPDSVKITTTSTTTGTTTKVTTKTTTYTTLYGVYSVAVTAVAHFEP